MPSSSSVSTRAAQFADGIRDVLAEYLTRDYQPTVVTIIAVTISPDFQRATVWLRTFPDEALTQVIRHANARQGSYRHALAQSLRHRTVPTLTFVADPTLESEAALANLPS